MGCKAKLKAPVDTAWCQAQCSGNPPNCPKEMCRCEDNGGILHYNDEEETPTAQHAHQADETEAPATAASVPATADQATGAVDDAAKMAAEQAAAAAAANAAAAAANAAANAANAAAAEASSSALAPGGDPMGCLATKDASEGTTDDWCRQQCADNPDNCPKTLCECNDDNGIMRFDPDDPDIPLKQEKLSARPKSAAPPSRLVMKK